MDATIEELQVFFSTVMAHLNERQRRVVAGSMARGLGLGGKTAVAKGSGLSRNTVIKAQAEVEAGIEPTGRLRALGGGDRPAAEKQPGLIKALEELVYPATRGTPMSPLTWTPKSTYQLARELQGRGFKVSGELVRRQLHEMGYSLPVPSKREEVPSHRDRDRQFGHVNALVAKRLAAGEPVISVDARKKALTSDDPHGGPHRQPEKGSTRVADQAFADRALREFAKAIPYGVYNLSKDEGWVPVGNSAATAEFAVASIRRWWNTLGRQRFPQPVSLLIAGDSGGSNVDWARAWKYHLAKFAEETGLVVTVCHLPPGTSKWVKIEHRLFGFISVNRVRPPTDDIRTIIELVTADTSKTGMTVQAAYDPAWHPTGVKISDKEFAAIPSYPHQWHGEWNYDLST